MPVYYFHLSECGSLTADTEGCELCDLQAARSRAILAARDLMRSEVATGKLCLSCHIDVADAEGHHLLQVRFVDAITVTGFHPTA